MYYPEQRHTLAWATVRRERLLPDHSIGTVEARNGQYLNLRDVVARGRVPARYIFVEATGFFRLRNETELVDLMLVEIGEQVAAGQVLAGKQATKGKRLVSPVTGVIVYVGQGRIIIQETPEEIEVEAGLTGQVVGIRPNQGVVVEAFGALAQGVWGNGRRLIGPLRIEPEDGLEAIFDDTIDRPYAGSIVITRRSLKEISLDALETQNIGGVVAPSMDAALYKRALDMNVAIMLTEGFGDIRMSSYLFSLLEGFNGRQTTLDAVLPTRWDAGRPEVFINLPPKAGERPPEPRMDLTLQTGMTVRLTRAPYAGLIGQVIGLPKTPQLLDNGLRVPCAQVDLITGGKVMIPLANLEIFGK